MPAHLAKLYSKDKLFNKALLAELKFCEIIVFNFF